MAGLAVRNHKSPGSDFVNHTTMHPDSVRSGRPMSIAVLALLVVLSSATLTTSGRAQNSLQATPFALIEMGIAAVGNQRVARLDHGS